MGIVVGMGGMRLRGGLWVQGAIRNIVRLNLPAGKANLLHLGVLGLIIEPKWRLEGPGGLGVMVVILIRISNPGRIRDIARRKGILNMARLRGIFNMARLRGIPNMARLRGIPNMVRLRGIFNMARLRGIPNMVRLRGILNMVRLRGVPNMARLSPLRGIGGPKMMKAIGMDRG
jgi:hypothetical protein